LVVPVSNNIYISKEEPSSNPVLVKRLYCRRWLFSRLREEAILELKVEIKIFHLQVINLTPTLSHT